ncbi:MAG: cysteine desulfurase [Magnetococcales bacterium]|nr:cysteine desulfurase [Magnetococcales bacterium]
MIYLDHNATSPLRPQVLEAMVPFFTEGFGNPSSVHGSGRRARQGLDEARRRVAALLEVHESQIVFTSGGTESNNMAIFGQAARHKFRGHLVTSTVEHPAVLQVYERLQHYGMGVTLVGVDHNGCLHPEEVRAALQPDTVLLSLIHANNETGVIQPLAAISEACRADHPNLVIHTDAVQSVGKIAVRFAELGVDMLSLSAHKWGGPKGVGALVMDKHLAIDPWLLGGGQERGRRSGTENLPGIVGCGMVAESLQQTLTAEMERLQPMQRYLEQRLREGLPGSHILGQQAAARLPNTTAWVMDGIQGETVVINLDLGGFAVSSGSACGSGRSHPSHVPMAMGIPAELAASMVRISLGWNTTQEEVERFVTAFVQVIKRLQQLSGSSGNG